MTENRVTTTGHTTTLEDGSAHEERGRVVPPPQTSTSKGTGSGSGTQSGGEKAGGK